MLANPRVKASSRTPHPSAPGLGVHELDILFVKKRVAIEGQTNRKCKGKSLDCIPLSDYYLSVQQSGFHLTASFRFIQKKKFMVSMTFEAKQQKRLHTLVFEGSSTLKDVGKVRKPLKVSILKERKRQLSLTWPLMGQAC